MSHIKTRQILDLFQDQFEGNLTSITSMDFAWNEQGNVMVAFVVKGCPVRTLNLYLGSRYATKYIPVEVRKGLSHIPNAMYDTEDAAWMHGQKFDVEVKRVIEITINY